MKKELKETKAALWASKSNEQVEKQRAAAAVFDAKILGMELQDAIKERDRIVGSHETTIRDLSRGKLSLKEDAAEMQEIMPNMERDKLRATARAHAAGKEEAYAMIEKANCTG
jgi:hypothetical protein